MDALAFRQVLSAYPTGVTVVATRDGAGDPCGLTVNSFSSVSLDPPLVMVCIDRSASSHDRLVESGTFAVSVLTSNQAGLAARFASQPAEVRFVEVAWHEAPTGDPVLDPCAASLWCEIEAVHPGGDHSILVGRVIDGRLGDEPALVFYRGAYAQVGRH